MTKKTQVNKNSEKNYFTEETEKAVLLYNKVKTREEKNEIFNRYLQYPLKKLIENVIHKYKFYNTGIAYSDLSDCMLEYLVEKLYKIKEGEGKAYSYLTVTARNYGILLSSKQAEKERTEFEQTECYELDGVSIHKHNLTNQQEMLSEFFLVFVLYIRKHLTDIFPNKEEISIADSFLDIFEKIEDVDFFNKKAIYIIIKEKTNCESRFVTNVVNILKANFYRLLKAYQEDENSIRTLAPVKRPLVKRRI